MSKNTFKNYHQRLDKKPIFSTKTLTDTEFQIPCRNYNPSRLFSCLRSNKAKEIVHLFEDTACLHGKHVMFYEYTGDNESMIYNLENILSSKDVFYVIDDTYEGLLTQDLVDYLIKIFKKNTCSFVIYSSNEILKGDCVYFFSFHLCYRFYDNIDVQKAEFQSNMLPRPKKFLSLNRQPRLHRLEIVDFILENNLIEDSLVSCFLHNFEHLEAEKPTQEQCNWYQGQQYLDQSILYRSLPEESLKRLKKHLPLHLDVGQNNPNQNHRHLPNPENLYQNTYWSIITERDFYDDRYRGWTEKVLKSLFYCHPFIVVGLPNTLSSLKEQGFMTFGSVIDESYDKIENDDERMNEVKKQIEYLSRLNYIEHYNLYQKLLPILNHNRQHYLNLNLNYTPVVLINRILEWYFFEE